MWCSLDTGPFPGIIDLFGSGGGLCEYRASLLARRGFAVLALAYFRFEDLPEYLNDVSLDYFEEAVDFMLQHSKVCSCACLNAEERG